MISFAGEACGRWESFKPCFLRQFLDVLFHSALRKETKLGLYIYIHIYIYIESGDC